MNIFVGNVSRQVTDAELKEAFEQYGEVKSAVIIKDRDTGVSRGFGFVEMENDEEANKAIAGLHQTELKGRPLNVNESRPREEKPRSGGGFNRRRPY
jgi:RNA recognition motif-containing protein